MARVLTDTVSTPTFQRVALSAALRSFVAFYWQSEPAQPLRSCALPNCEGLLSFNLRPVPWQSVSGVGRVQTFSRSLLCGHLMQACWCTYPAGSFLVGATLQPGALALLLDRPGAALADWTGEATRLLPVHALEEALRQAADFSQRVALLEAFLQPRFAACAADYRYDLVQAAIARFRHVAPVPHSMQQVAQALCVTPKSLARYFHQLVGLSPKRCAQLLRLKQTLLTYRHARGAVASEQAGYVDFAHFARASHRLVGHSVRAL